MKAISRRCPREHFVFEAPPLESYGRVTRSDRAHEAAVLSAPI